MIGKTLSHFQVTAKLGEGGMGEVYRATDTKLGREVAIKVLPEALATDAERLARFEREAKLLASLNHSSIAAIYSLESVTASGQSGDRPAPSEEGDTAFGELPAGPMHFLVMELAAGEDLKDRLRRGPVPMEEALPIALQIAQALEAAHETGIVHRDLKPANVMVDDEEQVRVLDFGLAKALDPTAADSVAGGEIDQGRSPLSLSPTLTAQMTGVGVLLGTAAYMSPEQARGKSADKRADIWAFGVVLWEMLTGTQMFDGETVSDTLAAVLRAEPDWDALPSDTPRPVHRLLRRCLVRNPRERLHDIADARLELEEALHPSDIGLGPEAEAPATGAGRKLLWTGLAAGLALGALLAALLLGGGIDTDTESVGEAIRVSSAPPAGVELQARERPAIALSPDGQRLVMVGWSEDDTRQLYVRTLSRFEWLPVAGTEGAMEPFFSPDGEWVAFFADDKLKKVPLSGGNPQVLCDAPNPWGGAWGPDGTIVFYPSYTSEGLRRVSELGGTPEVLTRVDSENAEDEHNWPQFTPDGRSLIFTIWKGTGNRSQIALLDLETGDRSILVDGGFGRLTPSGHLLYARGDAVYAVAFDLEKQQIVGSAIPIPEPIYRFSDYWLPFFTLGGDGTLAYLPGRSEILRELVAVSLDGAVEPLLEDKGGYMYPRLSPDGSKLAVTVAQEGSDSIYVVDLESGAQTRLTREGNQSYPLWVPDGQKIIYISDHTGEPAIYWRPADGSGEDEALFSATLGVTVGIPHDVSPDGRYLAFSRWEDRGEEESDVYGVYLLSLSVPGELQPFLVSDTEDQVFSNTMFAPDGRWVAYVVADATGRGQVYVQGFPEAGARHLVSRGHALKVRWAPDGRALYYREMEEETIMTVEITTEPRFRAEPPRILFDDTFDHGTYQSRPNFSVTPDGERLIMVRRDDDRGRASEIRIVLNWLDELEQLVPGGGS